MQHMLSLATSRSRRLWLLPALILSFFWLLGPAQAQAAVVRAVLFYSPSCPHCHVVMQQDLPPIVERFGDQLAIVVINTATEDGAALYQAAVDAYQIPTNRRGVPTMIVGETVLVGALEIPSQLPEIVETALANGGLTWPAIPGLAEGLPVADEPAPVVASADGNAANEPYTVPAQDTTTLLERLAQDWVGSVLAILVLLGLVGLVIWSIVIVTRPQPGGAQSALRSRSPWGIPLLVLIGLVVAIYLAYVEITHTPAVCGPIGECNTVQQSPYATLFGVLPIGVLGIIGYVAIGVAWLVAWRGPAFWRQIATGAVWAFALAGAVFSAYLTFLEPFVIGAVCAWCLTSAVVMALLLWWATAQATELRYAPQAGRRQR